MRVGEAKQRDIGKKRARIGPDAMDAVDTSCQAIRMLNLTVQSVITN